jgi:hypothetical protein
VWDRELGKEGWERGVREEGLTLQRQSIKNGYLQPDIVTMPVIPALQRLKQKYEFKANVACKERLCLKNPNTK